MRRMSASFGSRVQNEGIWRVVSIETLAAQWQSDLQFLVKVTHDSDRKHVHQLQAAGLGNVEWMDACDTEIGDVVVTTPHRSQAAVLYRPSDLHHGLQLTNRCNSNCLMCSQPPTPQADDWMVREAVEVIRHMGSSPPVLGLTGGEPLLLGEGLREVLDHVHECHPSTQVEILSNGRLLANAPLCKAVVDGLQTPTTWLVPLYGHVDFLHDFVVQAHGAFEQTLAGLLNLQQHRQPIQLRIVLIKPVLDVLPELCTFIGRNLPFVKEVALMACEPIGFALANRELCEVDLADWQGTLEQAARQLKRHSVPFLFMNTPLCALPTDLHGHAHRSISDWKNVYTPVCEPCQLKPDCAGFFAWHERGWKPAKTIPITREEYTA